MSGGKELKSRAVLGKKDLLSSMPYSQWSGICSLSSFLEKLAFCIFDGNQSSVHFVQHAELASFLLSDRDRQFKPWSMSLTLDLFRCLLVA